MYVVAYETSSLIYHAKPVCFVCNRCLFSLSPESGLCNFNSFIVTHRSLLMLGECASQDLLRHFSDLVLIQAHTGYIRGI